jgi:regulator of sigma D
MTKQNSLFYKYYKGETSLKEEQEARELLSKEAGYSTEQTLFNYFEREARVPENLEEDLLNGVFSAGKQKKIRRMKVYSLVSAAAVVLILFTVFLDVQRNKRTQQEDNFFVMEQALFQISESLQPPQEQDEMLVLWVDNDVEIIIN